MHKYINIPNIFMDAFYEIIASVMPAGLGTIRNHRGTTVALLQSLMNIDMLNFWNRHGTIGTTPGTTSTHGER